MSGGFSKRPLTIEQVKQARVYAVHHAPGIFTYEEDGPGEYGFFGIDMFTEEDLPTDGWYHRDDCDCEFCQRP